MLIGNVGAEPEVRFVDQNVAVARLRLATSERGYTLPNGTQVPERLRYTTDDDKQGQRRYQTEIWAENMEMLTPKTAMADGPDTDS